MKREKRNNSEESNAVIEDYPSQIAGQIIVIGDNSREIVASALKPIAALLSKVKDCLPYFNR